MRSSWACWWLLLAWALLLGQPVSGEEEGHQTVSLEEPDDPVETGQPQAMVEPNEVEEPDYSHESLEEPDTEPELTSEELEDRARSYRDDMEEQKRWGPPSLSFYKYMALRYMQLKNDDYGEEEEEPKAKYMHLEDSSITIQKAYGNIIKFRMFLKKGSCTDERMNHDDYVDYLMSFRHPPWQSRTCEKLDCVFTVFQDVRTYHEAVINSQCHPLILAEEMHYIGDEAFAPPLDDDYADLPDSSEDTLASNDDTPDVPISDGDTLDEPDSDLPVSDGDTPDVPVY